MSQTNTHLLDDKSQFYETSTSSIMTTSRFLLDDNSLCIPSINICDTSSTHLQEISHPTNTFPQISTIYQSPYSIPNNDTINCWNNNTISNGNTLPCDTNQSPSYITWNSNQISQKRYLNNLNDETMQQEVGHIENTCSMDNSLSLFTIPKNQLNFTKVTASSMLNGTMNYEYVTQNDLMKHQSFQYTDKHHYEIEHHNILPKMLSSMQNTPITNKLRYTEESYLDQDLSTFPKSWLFANFWIVDEDCTIARSVIYNYYLYTCHLYGETPINSAGLGKMLRSVFGQLPNRRLGSRGDSKYHYLKLQIRPDSYLLNISSEEINKIVSLYEVKKNVKPMKTLEPVVSDDKTNKMKIHDEYKVAHDLQNKPISQFLQPLFKITKISPRITDIIPTNHSKYTFYQNIFVNIETYLNSFNSYIIECFRNLDNIRLYNLILKLWSNSSILHTYNINDEYIIKYITNYHKEYYTHILKLLFNGNLISYYSINLINKVIEMFESIKNGLVQYACPLVSCLTNIFNDVIKICQDYKNLQQNVLNVYPQLTIYFDESLIKFYHDLSSKSSLIYNDEFSNTFNSYIYDSFNDIEGLIQLYHNIILCHHKSSILETLHLIYQYIYQIYHQHQCDISICLNFTKNFLVFSNILFNHVNVTTQTHSYLTLLHHLYFTFMQILLHNLQQNNVIHVYLRDNNQMHEECEQKKTDINDEIIK